MKIKLRLTTLSDNTAKMFPGLLAEWGWSILIETDEVNILFDTGGGISVSHNANTLDVDFSKIDKIVLSHAHYDHTGGLREVLGRMKKEVKIIAHPDLAKKAKYHSHLGQAYGYAGIPFQRQELENLGARFNLTT